MSGKLYIVATPIGNLEDITIRAIKILKEVDFIAAEDTRHSLKLLNHLNISKPLISYYKENEIIKSDMIIEKLLDGKNIALISDAGTPGISDPGEVLIKKVIEKNIEIIPIPGACACINALVASGLNTKEFIFIGFLSTNKKEKEEKIMELINENKTIILYEAPHKLVNTLKIIYEILGDRKIVLAKEITKIHESFIRNNISEVIKTVNEPKGEYVILIEGIKLSKKEILKKELINYSLEEHYNFYKNKNLEKKEIIKKIAKDRNVTKNEIYQYFMK